MAAPTVLIGILCTLVAGVAVSAEMVFSMVMLQMKWPYWRLTALSCVLCSALVVALLAVFKRPSPSASQMKWVFLLGLFSSIYWGFGIVAVQIGVDPGDVAALTSINIVVAAIMGRVFLNEALRPLHLISVILSLAGAVLIARPAFIFSSGVADRAPWYGYGCAIASGFVQGCFFICSRKAGDVSAGHLTLSALVFSGTFCISLPYSGSVAEAPFEVALRSPWEALGWTGVAFLTTMFSSFFSCAGAMMCPAAISATVYTASSMLFGYIVQSILFASTPEPLTITGASLMLCAVTLMALAGRTGASVTSQHSEAEGNIEQAIDPTNTSSAEDDTDSLASFVASEFSDFDFDIKDEAVRFRGRQSQLDPVKPEAVGVPS